MRELINNRSFMRVWAALFVSGLGDKIAILAFFALILDRTGNVADLGLLAAAQILPGILIGPAVGVVIDRWSRRAMMASADLLGVAVCLILPLIWDSLLMVYIAAALLSVARQITGPARMALIPDLVPGELLTKSNALTMLSQNLILLLGMAAGGLVVHHFGLATAFRIDALSFAASAVLLTAGRLQYQPRDEAKEATSREHWSDIRQGAVWIWSRPRLRFAVTFLGVVTIVTAMQPPLVFDFVRNTLGRSEAQLGLIFGAAGFGGLLGALAAGLLREKAEPLRVVTWLVALDGALLALFAINRNVPTALVLFMLFGALSTGIQINLSTFLQRETPREQRGRVFGWLAPMLGPISLASVLIGPALASKVGAAVVLGGAAAVELTTGLIGRVLLGRQGLPQTATDSDPAGEPIDAASVPDTTESQSIAEKA